MLSSDSIYQQIFDSSVEKMKHPSPDLTLIYKCNSKPRPLCRISLERKLFNKVIFIFGWKLKILHIRRKIMMFLTQNILAFTFHKSEFLANHDPKAVTWQAGGQFWNRKENKDRLESDSGAQGGMLKWPKWRKSWIWARGRF